MFGNSSSLKVITRTGLVFAVGIVFSGIGLGLVEIYPEPTPAALNSASSTPTPDTQHRTGPKAASDSIPQTATNSGESAQKRDCNQVLSYQERINCYQRQVQTRQLTNQSVLPPKLVEACQNLSASVFGPYIGGQLAECSSYYRLTAVTENSDLAELILNQQGQIIEYCGEFGLLEPTQEQLCQISCAAPVIWDCQY